jgi:peptidyl-prolyl cis-trans isomerase B (cyclophilin B)
MQAIALTMMFVSVLLPQKGYYAPDQPVNINVKAEGEVNLFLTDFMGRSIEPKGSVIVDGEKTVDVKALFPDMTTPGTYILYAVPKDKPNKEFVGTPLVISVMDDKRTGAPTGPMVIRVSPLCYVEMTTDKGPMQLAFYYDVAPNTVKSFLHLAESGYFDGLTFHRIVPDFVIQGGDPRGDGTGGPGYQIDGEFNTRKHVEGVLSMARSGDPNEAGGAMPRGDFANSAGSQFFVCLNYQNTQQLDRRYTAFGKVMNGMDAVKAIAAVPLADPESGRPKEPPRITKATVKPVTAAENPYPKMVEETQPNLIAP